MNRSDPSFLVYVKLLRSLLALRDLQIDEQYAPIVSLLLDGIEARLKNPLPLRPRGRPTALAKLRERRRRGEF